MSETLCIPIIAKGHFIIDLERTNFLIDNINMILEEEEYQPIEHHNEIKFYLEEYIKDTKYAHNPTGKRDKLIFERIDELFKDTFDDQDYLNLEDDIMTFGAITEGTIKYLPKNKWFFWDNEGSDEKLKEFEES